MDVKTQCILFREIVLLFFDFTDQTAWSHKLFPDVGKKLPGTQHIIYGRNELEKKLPAKDLSERIKGDFSDAFLFLKPLTNGSPTIPVLTLNYDFGRSIPETRLRVGLFLKHNDEIKAIGYRFESPEGIGKHHYYHVQMISGFVKDAFFPPVESTNWLPDEEPTFPLDARDSVDLILCFFIALYGRSNLMDSVSRLDTVTRKMITDKIGNLNVTRFSDQKIFYFWRIRITNSGVSYYFKTDYEPEPFRQHLILNYTNYEYVEITPQEWEDQAASDNKKTLTQ